MSPKFTPSKCLEATPTVMSGRRRSIMRISCPARLRGWWFSPHARAAVNARGFDPHSVIEACEAPEISTTAYDYAPDRFRYVKKNIVVIADPTTRCVVTVLLRSYEKWNNMDARKAVEL